MPPRSLEDSDRGGSLTRDRRVLGLWRGPQLGPRPIAGTFYGVRPRATVLGRGLTLSHVSRQMRAHISIHASSTCKDPNIQQRRREAVGRIAAAARADANASPRRKGDAEASAGAKVTRRP